MKELWINLLQLAGRAWWVEVSTDAPHCVYYFGPFSNNSEAEAARPGYVEDLEQEGAQGIKVAVKQCKPDKLTIDDELSDSNRASKTSPAYG